MKAATVEVIEALNRAPIAKGGGDISFSDYSIVEDCEDAVRSAASQKWEQFIAGVHNGSFIRVVQPELKRIGVIMADQEELIGSALAPAIRAVRLSGWSEIPRFPFELLVHGCCAEVEFSDILEPVFFYPRVFPVLLAGHFPCGWDGEPIRENWVPRGQQDLPDGKLMVHLIESRTEN